MASNPFDRGPERKSREALRGEVDVTHCALEADDVRNCYFTDSAADRGPRPFYCLEDRLL